MSGNSRVLLVQPPEGLPDPADFATEAVPSPVPAPGQVLVELLWLSLDPYMRGQMSGRHMSGALKAGDTLRGEGVVRVLEGGGDSWPVGSLARCFAGWQRYAAVDAASLMPLGFDGLPASLALGVLGMPGLTAWAGLKRLGQPKEGDTVLVSSAAGTVGATVGQLARLWGARAVGIAGGPAKCGWAVARAGFAGCIDYKSGDLRAGIAQHCPAKAPPLGGVDVYFDNVGGDTLAAAMENLSHGARVVLCGLIDQYNSGSVPVGPNPGLIIKSRAHVHGMVVYDHEDARAAMIAEISAAIKSGNFIYHEDITEGLENAGAAFCRLMRGDTMGKAVVKI